MTGLLAIVPDLDGASAQFRPLQRTSNRDGAPVGDIFAAALGSSFVLVGGLVLLGALVNRGSGWPDVAIPAGAAMVLGACALPWSVKRIVIARRFGRQYVEIDRDELLPGLRFRLHCGLELLQPQSVDLAVSLVAQEVVTIKDVDGDTTVRHDHLVQSFEERGMRGDPGDLLSFTHEFAIPRTGARSYRTGSWPVRWLVKVRLTVPGGQTFWQEYALPCSTDLESLDRGTVEAVSVDNPLAVTVGDQMESEPGAVYNVLLVSYSASARSRQAVLDVAPHLTPTQIGSYACGPQAPLLSNVSRQTAEGARARLEGVGAVVEVRQGGTVIEPPPGQRLPIPHGSPYAPTDSLPRPVDEAPDGG